MKKKTYSKRVIALAKQKVDEALNDSEYQCVMEPVKLPDLAAPYKWTVKFDMPEMLLIENFSQPPLKEFLQQHAAKGKAAGWKRLGDFEKEPSKRYAGKFQPPAMSLEEARQSGHAAAANVAAIFPPEPPMKRTVKVHAGRCVQYKRKECLVCGAPSIIGEYCHNCF